VNVILSMKLISKYSDCPVCGNGKLGNGEGVLIIEVNEFYRSCKCGWDIRTDEYGEVIGGDLHRNN
jgi:hypothetical protein